MFIVQAMREDSNTGQDFAYAQLEPGPVATPFEHRPISTELALCQRYYLRLGGAQYSKSRHQLRAPTGN